MLYVQDKGTEGTKGVFPRKWKIHFMIATTAIYHGYHKVAGPSSAEGVVSSSYKGSYCSHLDQEPGTGCYGRMRKPPLPVQTTKEADERIQRLISQELLCIHDVEDLNAALERNVELSAANSASCRERINEKISSFSHKIFNKTITAKEIISLYHLQHLSDEPLYLLAKKIFEFISLDQFPAEIVEEVAAALPLCISQEQFDHEASALIKVREVSDRLRNIKAKKIASFIETEESDQKRSIYISQLAALQEKDPEKYPPYLNELLEEGYIHLYAHLIEMSAVTNRIEGLEVIKKMAFTEISQCLLEIRHAIIQKVKKSLPANYGNRKFIIFIGPSGSGKSTALCFLRKDKMKENGHNYESENAREAIIDHSDAISFTLLPNIEITDQLIIIDFPGTADSRGKVFSLGSEFALKALVKEYQPKIVVMQSITNIEGKFAHISNCGKQLQRLFDNKERSILGLSKYLQNLDWKTIKYIKSMQREKIAKDQVNAIIGLDAAIKCLNEVIPFWPEALREGKVRELEEKQRQLAELKQENIPAIDSLPDTKEVIFHQRKIKEKEELFLKEIKLNSIIRFSNLDDPHCLSECLRVLSESQEEVVRVNPELALDFEDNDFLDSRFKNSLLQEFLFPEIDDFTITNLETFKEEVRKKSLIHLLSHSSSQFSPAVAQFLHLPEIDPAIEKKYNKKLIEKLEKYYVRALVCDINIPFIFHSLIENNINDNELIKKLINELKELCYIISNCRYDTIPSYFANPQTNIEGWQSAKEKLLRKKFSPEKVKLPQWLTRLISPSGIPYEVYRLKKISELSGLRDQVDSKLLENCLNEAETVKKILILLFRLASTF